MSEVTRYDVLYGEMVSREDGEFVWGEDFDRVTAERDAELAENNLLRDFSNKQAEHLQAIGKASGAMYFESTPEVVERICSERDALQALLTAADERADQAVNIIKKWKEIFGESMARRSELYVMTDAFLVALKPAEGGSDD